MALWGLLSGGSRSGVEADHDLQLLSHLVSAGVRALFWRPLRAG